MGGGNDQDGPKWRGAVTVEPAPDWFGPLPSVPAATDDGLTGGMALLLDESVVDLTGPVRRWAARQADYIATPAGIEAMANFSVDFDPTCQTIVVHHIRIHRDGAIIDHADPAAFEVLRRERDLERAKLDGRLTLHMTIPDIRVGDIVETCYSTFGGLPLLGGKHGAWIYFNWAVPRRRTRHVLRLPSERSVQMKRFGAPPEPIITQDGPVTVMDWTADDAPLATFEDLAPNWPPVQNAIQYSQWSGWAEAAALFAPGYMPPPALPDSLRAELDKLATAHPNAKARAVELLRFVQSGLRYLAVSVGQGGFVPRNVEDIWANRYGDCKDASRLYVAAADYLGLNACPALVDTEFGPALNDWAPTALAFNHCIVRLEHDGKVFWLDPTLPPQGGDLDNLTPERFGYALPLRAGQADLEFMGQRPLLHVIDAQERFIVGAIPDKPVTYETRVTYRGWRADDLRTRLSRQGPAAVFKEWLESLEKNGFAVTALEQVIENDDMIKNVITFRERYELNRAWQPTNEGQFNFTTIDYYLAGVLAPLNPDKRTLPIELGWPREITRTAEIEVPTDWPEANWDDDVVIAGARFQSTLKMSSKRRFILTNRFISDAPTAPASEAEGYSRLVDTIQRGRTVSLFHRPTPDRGEKLGVLGALWMVIRIFALIAALVAAVQIFGGLVG